MVDRRPIIDDRAAPKDDRRPIIDDRAAPMDDRRPIIDADRTAIDRRPLAPPRRRGCSIVGAASFERGTARHTNFKNNSGIGAARHTPW
jgi:hypothetical protein